MSVSLVRSFTPELLQFFKPVHLKYCLFVWYCSIDLTWSFVAFSCTFLLFLYWKWPIFFKLCPVCFLSIEQWIKKTSSQTPYSKTNHFGFKSPCSMFFTSVFYFQIRSSRSIRMRKDHPVVLHRGQTEIELRRDLGARWKAGQPRQWRSWTQDWVYASG